MFCPEAVKARTLLKSALAAEISGNYQASW
jgi:hypothetical protein